MLLLNIKTKENMYEWSYCDHVEYECSYCDHGCTYDCDIRRVNLYSFCGGIGGNILEGSNVGYYVEIYCEIYRE